MTSGDLLEEAVAELYSADPQEFTRRRQDLAARARSAGQVPVARQIAALRKPTRSAWVINQLARSDPGSAARLAALGAELRAAERSADGSRIRELTQVRRTLIATLVREALAVSGQAAAPAAMREEITSTFAAALADPEVAGQIERGTLVRAASRPGFGAADAPALTVVPPLPGSREPPGKPAKTKPEPGKRGQVKPAVARTAAAAAPAKPAVPKPAAPKPAAPKPAVPKPAARKPAEPVQAMATAKAEQALAEADQAYQAASQDEQQQQAAVTRLEHELAEARHRLRMAAATARQAQIAQRNARQAVARLKG